MYVFLFLFILSFQISAIISVSKCEDFDTCGTCILNTFDNCEWCSTENYKGKRCQSKKSINNTWCEKPMSKPDIYLNITNVSFNDNQEEEIVQFIPRNVAIKSASPGHHVDIPMYYQPAKDAPLDIYLLIDNSRNLINNKDIIIKQSKLIFEETKNYTNNIRLGMGTFVEKPALPYADPDKQLVYTFENHLSLTNDTEELDRSFKNLKGGANYDDPEDILDALMQVMLCKQLISWRNDSRRVIVVFTDEFYHAAGDGKTIGAFDRYTMGCRNNKDMAYIDTNTDYPSIPQVNKVVKDNGFVIIFAYFPHSDGRDLKDHYKLLSQKIYGSKYITSKYANIAGMIKEEYVKIIQDVHIRDESPPNIRVTINKDCLDCKARNNNPLKYVANVEVLSCPNPPKDKDIIRIIPMSVNEELLVEIEYKCQCDCEKSSSTEISSAKCNGYGDYQCGICRCNPDRSGDDCLCNIASANSTHDYNTCRMNPSDALPCSGHGECSCGKCELCHEGFSGTFCQYDKNSCPRPNGKLCSGHGKCMMGQCECDQGWVYSPDGIKDCGCTTDRRSCIAPYSDKVCSGNGECNCGRCSCHSTENMDDTCTGQYCDKCAWFAAKRCEELQDYAYCRYLNQTSCEDDYNLGNTAVVFANRKEINSPNNTEWYMANWCRVKKGNDDSIFVFKYFYSAPETDRDVGTNNTKIVLVIQRELDEKPPANIWVAVGSAVGGILLIGLLSLLLWKCLTDMYDAREYDNFVKKAKAAGYDVNMTENPWYEPPTTTFINPLHNRAC